MKKFLIILTLVLAATTVSMKAQKHYVGVRGGWGGMDARFYPAWDTPFYWGIYTGGVSWKYYSTERYLGGLEINLEYIQRGYQYDSFSDETVRYRRKIDAVMLPIFWQPHLYMANDNVKLFLNAGLTFSYNISSSQESIDIETREVLSSSDYEMLLVRDNRWGYGLCGGFGVGVTTGRFELVAEGRYYFGYADILKRATVYPTNIFQRSPIDNITFTLGLYYRLGQESGLSQSDSRRLRRAAVRNLRRGGSEITE